MYFYVIYVLYLYKELTAEPGVCAANIISADSTSIFIQYYYYIFIFLPQIESENLLLQMSTTRRHVSYKCDQEDSQPQGTLFLMRFSASARARNRIRGDEISLIAARINERDAGSSPHFVRTRFGGG